MVICSKLIKVKYLWVYKYENFSIYELKFYCVWLVNGSWSVYGLWGKFFECLKICGFGV